MISSLLKCGPGWSDLSSSWKCARCWSCGCLCPCHAWTDSEQMYGIYRSCGPWDPSQGCTSSTKIPFSANGISVRFKDAKQRIEKSVPMRSWLVALLKRIISLQPNQSLLWNRRNPMIWREDKMKDLYEHLNRLIDLKSEFVPFTWIRARPLTTPWYLRCSQTPQRHLKLALWLRLKSTHN